MYVSFGVRGAIDSAGFWGLELTRPTLLATLLLGGFRWPGVFVCKLGFSQESPGEF